MANIGRIVWGVVLLFFGLILIGTIILAALGILFVLIGVLLIIVGAVTGGSPKPQVVVVQQPVYYPAPQPAYSQYAGPPPPVTVNVQQAAAVPPPPQIMRRCHYCNNVYPEAQSKCPSCGAGF